MSESPKMGLDSSKISDELIRAVQEGDFPRVRNIVLALTGFSQTADKYKQLYEQQKNATEALEKKIDELQQPPLSQGIIIGPSPDDEKNVIVGFGGQRFEVQIAADARLTPAALCPGSEAWLNQDRQIIKVRKSASGGDVGEVTALFEDGVIEVKSRANEGVVVECVPDLREKGLQVGDRVRIDSQLAIAFEKLPSKETKELELEEVPDVSYHNIGGLDAEIEQIKDAIELPYLYNQLFDLYRLKRPKGILLYGPPGCGKTMTAKAIANSLTTQITDNLRQVEDTLLVLARLREENFSPDDLAKEYADWTDRIRQKEMISTTQSSVPSRQEIETELKRFLDVRRVAHDDLEAELRKIRAQLSEGSRAYFMSIKGPELLNKYVGETEHSIRRLFLKAKLHASPNTPVVMFFDEIEALFRRRGSRLSSDVESTIVPQFLSEIDGVEELNNVVIIGATNRQDLLDPAILRPGRLDIKIKIDRPNRTAAQAIFRKYITLDLPLNVAETLEGVMTDTDEVLNQLIERAVGIIYDDASLFRISGQPLGGQTKTLPWQDFVSGAMIANIVNRTKKRALKREIYTGRRGIQWEDLLESIREEFEQNKDQLASTTLNLPEEGLTIEVMVGKTDDTLKINPWLRPLERPWQQHMQRESELS